MAETILNAYERTVTKKFRETGFIPGVLYGDSDSIANTTPVKFQTTVLTKILKQHGSNAKIWINYGNKKSFGFIKEVQKHPLEGNVIHIDVQLVSQNHEVKMHLPISFKGKENLEQRRLVLNVTKSEIDVFGKASLMPDIVEIDVSEKEIGDTLTLNDFTLDPGIKITDNKGEIYGTITYIKEQAEEEPVVTEAAEETKETKE